MNKPLIIFDGECGFCRFWIERWKSSVGDQADFQASQDLSRVPEGLSKDDFKNTVVLVEPDGTVSNGAEAVFKILALEPSRRWPLKIYKNIPGMAQVSELAYKAVARNRPFFSKLTRLLIK